MKAGNRHIDTDSFVKNDDSTNVVQTKKIAQNAILLNLLPVLAMVIAIVPGIVRESSGVEVAKVGILTLVLTSAAVFYIRMNEDSLLSRKFSRTFLGLCYILSIVLLLIIPNADILSFWMLGGLLTAIIIDSKLGLLFHFNFVFILGITMSLRPENVIQLLILGVLLSLLSGALKQKSTVIYAAIIILSSNITLSFVIHNFIFETDTNINYLSSFFSIFAVLVTAFLLCQFLDRFMVNDISTHAQLSETENEMSKGNAENVMHAAEITSSFSASLESSMLSACSITTLEPEADPQYSRNLRTSYEILVAENNELILKLKAYSENLYRHAVLIGDISGRAAKMIGADELLAKAGGLYHEIGKISGKNYIEEGLMIAEEYSFPNDLKDILKQHNIKFEKPTSVEAAIVMLSDNVVSTIEYIEKTEDNKFTTNKIIDNIFQLRMEKGTFDESGLSVKDFKILKEFYQKEFAGRKLV